jgi:Fic-DOC domain mobile mystery protein B
VTSDFADIGDGHTELGHDERGGLVPLDIATRSDLHAAEERSIATALLRRRSPTPPVLLDDAYLRRLHRDLFGAVWTWAGTYRRRVTNIGIEPAQISTAVRALTDDALGWIEYSTYDHDELAARFHHRLVAIHPFPNGNGRHGRIAADLLAVGLGRDRFTWGARLDVDTSTLRRRYVDALRAADDGDIEPLLVFTRE